MREQPSEHPPRRSLARRLVRIFLKTLLGLVIILLIVFLLIQTPFIQNIARAKVESYLSRKLNSRVRIGHLDITFFQSITLRDVYVEDRHQDTLLSAGLVSVRLRMLALLHNNLAIHEIWLKDVTTNILRRSPGDTTFNYQFIIDAFTGPPSPTPGANKSTPMHIGLNTVILDNIHFVYADTLTGNTAILAIGHSSTGTRALDADRQLYDVSAFHLQNTTLVYRNSKTAIATTARITDLRADQLILDVNNLTFRSKNLQLDSSDVAFDNGKKPRQKKGMDYYHLRATDLTLHGEDLAYSPDSISGHITKGQLAEQSGFRLNRLQTRFCYSDHKAVLQDLLLQTPGTLLQRSATLRYDSVTGITTSPAHTLLTLDLPSSHVQLKDILTFAPFLATQPLFRHPDDTWRINARLDGSFDAVTIHTLQFSGIKDIQLDMAGSLRHPIDSRRIRADFMIRNLSGSRSTLLTLLPKNTLPDNISIPSHYNLHGHLTGGRNDLTSNLTLNTTSGTLILQGTARNFSTTTTATYDLALQTKALDLGAILRDSIQYGKLTANFHLKGSGLDIHTANTVFSAGLQTATFRQYTYHNLTIDGSLAGEKVILHSSIHDTALRFQLQATAGLARKFPSLQLDWNIDTVDFHALHLANDTLQAKGHLTADFAGTDPDSLQGTLKLAGINLLRGSQRLATDSIVLVATRQQDIEDIQLYSEMADLDWHGRYKPTETLTALQHTIDTFYHLTGFKDTAFTPQDWTLDIHLRSTPLVWALLPSLKSTDTIGGRIAFNSDRNYLQLALKAPRIDYGANVAHDVDLNAATTGDSLRYDLMLADVHGSGLVLYRTDIHGAVKNDSLTITLLLRDAKNKDRYRIAGELQHQQNAAKFILNPDSLLLNYDRWQVSRDNYLVYDSSGLLVHNLTISNNTDSLALNSTGATGSAPLDARFGNFRLSTISRLANQDSVIADGILTGNAEIRQLTTNPVFTSDLKVTDLFVRGDTLGNLAIKVDNEKANAFSADISLRGKNNDLDIKGQYFTGESRMDLRLALNELNLGTFSHITAGLIDSMSGVLKGQLAITGTIEKPLIKGYLYFDSSRIIPTVSGEPLLVSKDRINFDEDGFNFSEFHLQDSAGNKLIIDGNVFTKDYRDFGFDVSLNAQNFRLVNTPEYSNREFYGKLNLDAAINLEGRMTAPIVDGDVRINKQTNFYYVLQTPDPEVVDRLGVVRFIDHNTGDTLLDRKSMAIHAKKSKLKGVDLSMNIQTDSSAVFNIVVDPRSGDALNARGLSFLVFQMDKSGKMSLTGSFEADAGYYSLSFNVLKRKFAIDRGSVITWTGDPYSATINLTASYTANTPSLDLIANQLEGRPPSDLIKFKQKLPFLVTLKMGGELLRPDINFDISLPANLLALWPDVDQRLQQIRSEESELNKQVFALLLLNRFVGADPLNSVAGGGASLQSLAFQSGSQILTNQLDQLAASLIKEVDIHFDLNSQQDFSTNTEIDYTELNVSVSKQLPNDRLRVSVGSTFDVLGKGAPNQSANNLAGDVAVDYKLSKDGRYLLRAYRQNNYEAAVEGQVVETGVSFIISFEYNKFKEIFRRAEDARIQQRKTLKSSKPSNQ
ncbi:translocation/assembly module TamB domain-containing protein [Puia dinghuensis]|uniref:Translocation and assembly module TamB C-terminal domain-containing protein n=1 Tax=Puia dinghuensis TaxID=1792502 RepID=A0A8J2UD43_9BACT|nr:translocation/assembly module TamB domain-containing protein [Puia dinghuensis]GGA98994.1 hypothetical protein GCM10011511_22890 [Puia dinghuensis]